MEFIQITSRQNTTLRHLARLAREKKYRLKTGEMVCEGEKMLDEALRSGIPVRAVLVREGAEADAALIARASAQGAALYTANAALFAAATDVETPQGLLFSCVRPVRQAIDFAQVGRAILLDGIQDPGNLGTILRTADCAGMEGLLLSEQCADIFARSRDPVRGLHRPNSAQGSARYDGSRVPATGLPDAPGGGCLRAARTGDSGLCRSA